MHFLEKLFETFEAYYVGGYVRDLIRGYESLDIDIAVDASLKDFLPFVKKYNPYIMTKYENCSFSYEGRKYSISRMRKDIMCDGRQAKIQPVHTIEEDALRRDFTINAIYMKFNGEFCDPVGGIQDLKDKKVQFIGEPEKRIKEDQLRMLRYFRFCALLEVMPADDIVRICEKYYPIETVSKERIKEEYIRLLKLKPSHTFLDMIEKFYNVKQKDR
ncbi:MAG: CCA tRNA nucleotidyltransferase [Alphaproteobacteria bacterium]|nr:MAG: CCA tRNA nucleotidyltransferase [Alphaproteobacteria bacterium]